MNRTASFLLSLVLTTALAAASFGQDMVFVGNGLIQPNQKVNVCCNIGGVNLQLGIVPDLFDQPYFVGTSANGLTGNIYAVFPTAASPRGVDFSVGRWPKFIPVNVWLGDGWAWQTTLPSPLDPGYSWYYRWGPSQAAYTNWTYDLAVLRADAKKVLTKAQAKAKAVKGGPGSFEWDEALLENEKPIKPELGGEAEENAEDKLPKGDKPKKEGPKDPPPPPAPEAGEDIPPPKKK